MHHLNGPSHIVATQKKAGEDSDLYGELTSERKRMMQYLGKRDHPEERHPIVRTPGAASLAQRTERRRDNEDVKHCMFRKGRNEVLIGSNMFCDFRPDLDIGFVWPIIRNPEFRIHIQMVLLVKRPTKHP